MAAKQEVPCPTLNTGLTSAWVRNGSVEIRELDGSGILSIEEPRLAVALLRAVRSNNAGIDNVQPPKPVQEVLAVFDEDKSDTADTADLMVGAKLYDTSKERNKKLTKVVLGLSLLILVIMTSLICVIFAVVEISKETKASVDGTMTVAGSNITVKIDNPGFTTATSTQDAGKDGNSHAVTTLVDAHGVPIVTAVHTDADGVLKVLLRQLEY